MASETSVVISKEQSHIKIQNRVGPSVPAEVFKIKDVNGILLELVC